MVKKLVKNDFLFLAPPPPPLALCGLAKLDMSLAQLSPSLFNHTQQVENAGILLKIKEEKTLKTGDPERCHLLFDYIIFDYIRLLCFAFLCCTLLYFTLV